MKFWREAFDSVVQRGSTSNSRSKWWRQRAECIEKDGDLRCGPHGSVQYLRFYLLPLHALILLQFRAQWCAMRQWGYNIWGVCDRTGAIKEVHTNCCGREFQVRNDGQVLFQMQAPRATPKTGILRLFDTGKVSAARVAGLSPYKCENFIEMCFLKYKFADRSTVPARGPLS